MTSWATVPTTISERAVAMPSQMESSVAKRAIPGQSVARSHVSDIVVTPFGSVGTAPLLGQRARAAGFGVDFPTPPVEGSHRTNG